jgi:hypothetical protein
MATAWTDLRRPVLRDGLHVVRRDDRHLQIGLDDPDRLVLPDRPGLHDALRQLHRPPPESVRGVVDGLVAGGWVVDGTPCRRLDAPRGIRLLVDPMLAHLVTRTLAAADVRRNEAADTQLVVTVGEPERSVSDALVRDDVAHLWLALLPGRVRIGPFVDPGRTPCLRCLDAHLGDVDPRRATVLHQLEQLPRAPAFQPDPLLVQLGAAWAVRDVVRQLEGEAAASRSSTVTVTADLEATRRDWLRHPHCGCAWG